MNKTLSNWDGSENELMTYEGRPISVLAILSGISGLVAGLAFAIPGLGVAFIVSLATAVAATLSNRREPKSLMWFCYLGVFIGTLGTVWNLTSRSFYQNHMVAMGEKFAQEWLQLLIDDKLDEAICLRMDYLDRPLEGSNLTEYFQLTVRPPDASEMVPPPNEMKQSFLDSKTIQNFLTSGKETKLRLLPEKTRHFEHTGRFEVEAHFEVDFLLNDGHGGKRRKSQNISVALGRIQHTSSGHWQITRFTNLTAPDAPPEDVGGTTASGINNPESNKSTDP
jgi:hypothetical protein